MSARLKVMQRSDQFCLGILNSNHLRTRVGHDGTLATMPGPGYTRHLSYDEERQMIGIAKEENQIITPVLEFGYGYDGGRRYRHDLVEDVIDWFPCGVACCAGELVTMRSSDGGDIWETLHLSLSKGGAKIKDGIVTLGAISGGRVAGSYLGHLTTLDQYSVSREGQISSNDEEVIMLNHIAGLGPIGNEKRVDRCGRDFDDCRELAIAAFAGCLGIIVLAAGGLLTLCCATTGPGCIACIAGVVIGAGFLAYACWRLFGSMLKDCREDQDICEGTKPPRPKWKPIWPWDDPSRFQV